MKAKDYKKRVLARQKKNQIFDITCPSGDVWRMREAPIQQFIVAGKLPSALAAKMAVVAANNNSDVEQMSKEFQEQLTPEDIMANLEFGRDLLLYSAVEPRIAINPKDEDEIAPEDIDPLDFPFLISWVMTGGKSGESLGTFR